MKYIAIAFSLTIFQVLSHSSNEIIDVIPLDTIVEDVGGRQKIERDNVLRGLNFYVKEGKPTASYILAFVYYTGSYGTKVDIERAINLLFLPVEKGISDAKHLLGTILVTRGGVDNLRRGVNLLEEASLEGVTDSSINLYSLYQKGRYNNIDFLSDALKEASEQGDYMAAVYWGHVILDRAVAERDRDLLSDSVIYLQEKFKSGEYTQEERRDIYYLFVGIYGLPGSPLYDELFRDFYMKRASESGHPMAKEFVRDYLPGGG